MDYIIFDLEATCWSESHDLLQQEIIEIGAFHVDRFGEVQSKFSSFVRPVIHPYLSPFCTELTSITQGQVDQASDFPVVFGRFNQWVEEVCEDKIHYASWGKMDMDLIRDDCQTHHLDLDWEEDYIDLKQLYNRMKGNAQPYGFKKSLRKERMEFIGTEHRAIDDAYNLTRLFIKYIEDWRL